MTVEIRGIWTLCESIKLRWDDAGLDTTFRAEWTDSTYTQYPVLHDTEAPANAPGPYCVYEVMEPVIVSHHSGNTSTTVREIQRATVRFWVHARSSATEDAKTICQRLAKAVATAYDASYGALRIGPDSHVQTTRGPDVPVREGDEEWSWMLQWDMEIDCVYTQPS